MKPHYDVIVCGGGTAGVAAAVCSARNGAETLLIERCESLGGILTTGNVSYIMDLSNKQGFAREFVNRMWELCDGMTVNKHAEVSEQYARYVLEDMCLEANVTLRYGTIVTGVEKSGDKVTALKLFSKSGFETVTADAFIDTTGDGDVCALAGCGYDLGDEKGKCQPMSYNVTVTGVKLEDIKEYCTHVPGIHGPKAKRRLYELLVSLGMKPSSSIPFFMPIPGETDRFVFSCNHQYEACAFSADDLTKAVIEGRRECFAAINTLKKSGGIWKDLKIIGVPEHIGVREGRRIHGKYTVTKEDMINGTTFENPACHVTFGVDIHCRNGGWTDGGVKVCEDGYDIPFEALMAKDFENLYMAGRCISGDHYAHASYRVMGNTLMMGESIGTYCGKKYGKSNKE
ncbi:MAG: FAD-dependent oxidoreductase [Acutalibacteraceae bacterium]